MTDQKWPILIGDADAERVEWLSRFLGENYKVATESAETLDKVCALARESTWLAVFIADTIPLNQENTQAMPEGNLRQLRGANPTVPIVCLVTRDEYPNAVEVPTQVYYVPLRSCPPPEESDQIKESLKPLRGILPPVTITPGEVALLCSWRREDRRLHEQIRSLSLKQDLKDGESSLYGIIHKCIDCRGVERIDIGPLVQGKSGARVFRLAVKRKGGAGEAGTTDEYVLKLSKARDVWKLQSEVGGYLEAKKSKLYSRYEAHLPALATPQSSMLTSEPFPNEETGPPEEFAYIASNRTWNAIYYDFLGGSLGECMALETALVSAPDKLREKTAGVGVRKKFSLPSDAQGDVTAFRENFLDTVLTALCDIWYIDGAGNRREIMPLWDAGELEDRKYLSLPPYYLAARTRQWAQEFLESEEAEMGERVFPGWNACSGRVAALTRGKDTRALGRLGEEMPAILSPVHGDLNASNVFLWLRRESFPFLIDLPSYQPLGHALQDFARLEVEVKFALMDRQKESPASRLAAYDHSPQQAPLWRELEHYLLDDGTREGGEPAWGADGFRDNVRLTYRLVKVIRDKAERVQQQSCPGAAHGPAAFMDEYLPALLYHTTRAATYPTLSVFKRLLAVYSAGLILQRLGV